MHVIVTVDDGYGVAYNHRRQSRDPILCTEVLESLSPSERLVVSPYSLALFPSADARVRVCDDPMCDLAPNEIAFLECTSIRPYAESITQLTVYHWNRRYAQDVSLGIIPKEAGFHLIQSTDFVGMPHQKITKEIYRK